MNKSFREALAYHSRKTTETLTHVQTVQRLYRRALRTCFNWYIDRDLFNDKSEEIRQQFEANRNVEVDSSTCKRLIRETEEELQSWLHPDPYTRNYLPGGTSFMRNTPMPLELVYSEHKDGIPQEVLDETDFVHADQVPISSRPVKDRNNVDNFVVDYAGKRFL